jgi:hypothetical protein
LIDSKGGDFGCFWLAKDGMGCLKREKREQAPELQAELSMWVSIAKNKKKSRGF